MLINLSFEMLEILVVIIKFQLCNLHAKSTTLLGIDTWLLVLKFIGIIVTGMWGVSSIVWGQLVLLHILFLYFTIAMASVNDIRSLLVWEWERSVVVHVFQEAIFFCRSRC